MSSSNWRGPAAGKVYKMFVKSRLSLLGLVALLIFINACSNVQYRRTLRYWTRSQDIYSATTLAAKIIWHVTYLSPEYRMIAREKINEWKKVPPGEMTSYPEYLTSNESGEFLVSIFTPRGYPSLTNGDKDFWEFTLDFPTGESVLPSSVVSVKLTPTESRLFPYTNIWSRFYYVKFPVNNLTFPFTISLRSAAVTSFLDWN